MVTLRKLKEILNKVPESALDRPLMYNSEEYLMNGNVESIMKTEETKYLTEDGDIFSLEELLEEEFFESKKEVEENCTKIPKGTYYITL
nr:MAG TPA: hypothetical protein [Caudoviricetes sp.]